MYLRTVKVPSSNGNVNEYVRVVEAYRQDGKVKQRTIADLGRNRAKGLIVGGHVAVSGRTIVEPKRPVKPGETIVVDLPPAEPTEVFSAEPPEETTSWP